MSIAAKLLGLGAGAGRQIVSRVLPAGKERILAELEKNAPEMMRRAAQKNTGFTFDPRAGKFLEPGEQAGSMMATVPNLPGQTSGMGTARNVDELLETLRRPENVERFRRGEYVGAWNPEGQGVGLDPSKRFLTRLNAIRSGLKTEQMGGFDLYKQAGYDVTPEALKAARNQMIGRGAAVAGGGFLAADAASQGGLSRDLLAGLRGESQQGQGVAQSVGGTLRNVATDPFMLAGAVVPGGKLLKAGSKAAKMVPSIDDALSGVTKATTGGGSARSLDELLAATKNATGETGTTPSDLSKKITSQLEAQVVTEGKKKKLVFGDGSATQYPEELKQLGLQPIQGYNYMATGTEILDLPQPIVLETLKGNIRALLGKGGARDFYIDVNDALRGTTGGKLSNEQLGGAFAPFSMGTAVPRNAVQARRYIENPELYPGRMPGEGTTVGGQAWVRALRSTVNENPLDPFNFSNAGKQVKVGSFADNTALPTTSRRVTVDRHAVQAAMAMRPLKDKIIPDLGDERVYRLFEQAYQEVADELGVLPSALQSEVWDVWRRIMVKTPGASSPSGFFLPANPSDIWKLDPSQRKVKLRDILSKSGKDETFLGDAGLL